MICPLANESRQHSTFTSFQVIIVISIWLLRTRFARLFGMKTGMKQLATTKQQKDNHMGGDLTQFMLLLFIYFF